MSAHLVASHLYVDGQPLDPTGQPTQPESPTLLSPDPVLEYLSQPGHDGSAAVGSLEPNGAS